LQFLFEIPPKFIDFVNSDDYNRKIASKSIRPQPVCGNKKQIYDYAHSFCGED